jgi:hypothetical protein
VLRNPVSLSHIPTVRVLVLPTLSSLITTVAAALQPAAKMLPAIGIRLQMIPASAAAPRASIVPSVSNVATAA